MYHVDESIIMEKDHFETKLIVWIPKSSAKVSPNPKLTILRHSRLERKHFSGSLDENAIMLLFCFCSCQTMVS